MSQLFSPSDLYNSFFYITKEFIKKGNKESDFRVK
jgi:hypothetical protein